MNYKRGDVVLVDFAPTNPAAGIRPALIVQNDRDNVRMDNTVAAQITTNTSRAHEDTQLLIEKSHPDWASSGLRFESVVNCSSLACVARRHVKRVLGSLSDATMAKVNDCLKAVLKIP